MKVMRRFQVRDTGDSQHYQLEVDGELVGSCEFLGIEESLPAGFSESVLELMLQQGSQRTTAKAFLWQFQEEKKRREDTGGTLFVWGQKIECER